MIVILILKDGYVGDDVEDDGNQKDREIFQSELAGKSLTLTVTLREIQDGLINLNI